MAFQKNQILTLSIESLSNDGSGVAHHDGQAVFVAAAAPGDVAEVRIVKPMKGYAFGKLEKLLTPGPGRVKQDCPVAGPCGGCGLRHISYAAECAAKTQFVRDAFERLAKLDVPVHEVLGAPAADRYRNKVQLPVGTDENGHLVTGFFAGRSHRIVPCADCKLQPDWMNALAARACTLLEENGTTANVYAFVRYLSSRLPENSLTAVSNGACCVVGNQAYVIQKGSRMANNSAIASMGYGLPAAIGTCIAGGRRTTICLEGDGSIMMNLQELQTILTNKLPIKIFLINNNGYHSIRLTQNNLFKDHCKIGIGPESGDLSFPEFRKIAEAFGYPYSCAHSNAEMKQVVDAALAAEGPTFCEIFTDTQQVWEPKSATKRLPDGTLVSPPLEDLAPFLPREELEQQMFIPLVPEG